MTTNATVEFPNAIEQMTRGWLAAVDSIYKVQEQNEKMLVGMLEHQRQAREEGRRIAEQMIVQMGENQKQIGKLVETASKLMVDSFRVPGTKN